jgi:mono/diheme cytochrome c family protein
VTCHGISGDGAGPTASILEPYPRDYRDGIFKYTSTLPGQKPLSKDLRRTLHNGIPGTAMPTFAQLSEREIEALVEYIKYLSIRGETERFLLQTVVDDDATLPIDRAQVIEEGVLPAARSWSAPQRDPNLVVVPPPRPPKDTPEQMAALIAKGRDLYLSKKAQCIKCHGTGGDGKGEETELYDDWNKRKKGETPQQTEKLAARFKLPIALLHPRDFRQGQFHGGSRPEDLYLRVYIGIKGTPMPAAGAGPGTPGALTPEEIWQVVYYVRSLGGK